MSGRGFALGHDRVDEKTGAAELRQSFYGPFLQAQLEEPRSRRCLLALANVFLEARSQHPWNARRVSGCVEKFGSLFAAPEAGVFSPRFLLRGFRFSLLGQNRFEHGFFHVSFEVATRRIDEGIRHTRFELGILLRHAVLGRMVAEREVAR